MSARVFNSDACEWQQLWLKELESYLAFPPLQDPETYNLVQVLEQVKKMGTHNPSQ